MLGGLLVIAPSSDVGLDMLRCRDNGSTDAGLAAQARERSFVGVLAMEDEPVEQLACSGADRHARPVGGVLNEHGSVVRRRPADFATVEHERQRSVSQLLH